MKDTIITAPRKRKEILILLVSFIFAFFLNVYAIIAYKHPFIELFTQIHVVIRLYKSVIKT